MTLSDLDAISAALEAVRTAYALQCLAEVDRKTADALAHARNAVTGALLATPDGRRTVRRAGRSPSFSAAASRLSELWTALAGDSVVSLRGLVRQCREAAYRRAWDLHRPWVPPELLVSPDPAPTKLGVAMVRGAAIHGMDPRKELEAPIAGAIRRLGAAVALAGSRDTSGPDVLATWHKRTRDDIARTVLTLLSDSVEYAGNAALQDLVHPDHKAES